MARKANRDEIVANLNARIRLAKAQGRDPVELQDFLDAICRQHIGIEPIAVDTAAITNAAGVYERGEL